MFTAHAEPQTRLGGSSLLDGPGDQLAHTVHIDRGERVLLEHLGAQVLGEEAVLGIVAADAQGGLGEVVGAEAEEVGHLGDPVGDEGGTRQLDHGADLDVDPTSGAVELLGQAVLDDLALGGKLHRGEDQRNHDVQVHRLALTLQDGQGGADDGTGLHVGNLRVEHGQAHTTGTEHRILLVQLLHLGQQATFLVGVHRIGRGEFHLLHLEGLLDEARQELVQRWVEQPHGDRQSLHRREDALEVLLLHRQDLVDGRLALLGSLGGDHLVHGRQSVGTEEHVLGAAQTDSLGAKFTCLGGVGGVVGIGPHTQTSGLVGPGEHLLEVRVDLRGDERQGSSEHLAGGAVQGDGIALLDDGVANREGPGLVVDLDAARPGDARFAHATGDDGCVRGHAAVGSEYALGLQHAVDVVGGRLETDEDDAITGSAPIGSYVGVEDGLTDGSTRGGR